VPDPYGSGKRTGIHAVSTYGPKDTRHHYKGGRPVVSVFENQLRPEFTVPGQRGMIQPDNVPEIRDTFREARAFDATFRNAPTVRRRESLAGFPQGKRLQWRRQGPEMSR